MVHPTPLLRSSASRRQGLLCGWIRRARALILALLLTAALPTPAWADGAQLFSQHCAGCHVNGGNIIRRGKTLKLAALERQNLASRDAIAGIAAAGIGQMGGYGAVLGEAGVAEVAEWVWQQAQLGWPKAG
jgi:cytochrome c6